jgi:hypothetical protein
VEIYVNKTAYRIDRIYKLYVVTREPVKGMTMGKKGSAWEHVKCTDCGADTLKHKDWNNSVYLCKRCRLEKSDIEGVLFEILEFRPLFYEEEYSGMASKLEHILSKTGGDGTTKGYWREVKDSIASDERLASLFLKVASEFRKLQREQNKAERRNGAVIAGTVGRTRRLS